MTFRPLGEALGAAYRTVLPELRFEINESAGSVDNLDQLQRGAADLGLALADVAYMAFNARVPDVTTAGRIRGIAVLHSSLVHVLVPAQSQVRSIADLRGRRIGVGAPGSGTVVTSSLLLHAFGVAEQNVHVRTMPFIDSADALSRGDLDAAFIVAAAPVEAVRRATMAGARLLEITGATSQRLWADYPFLKPAIILPGTYPGHSKAVETARIDVLLVCRDNLDDVLVYRLTKALFEVLPNLTRTHDFLGQVTLQRAPATPIPLHAGAAWYYRERELSR